MNNQNSGYGQAQIGALPLTTGSIFVVMGSSDTDRDRIQELFPVDSYGEVRYFTSVAAAYSAMKSNRNDIMILAGSGTHEMDTMLTVSKSRVHIWGLDYLISGRVTGQRTKIQLSTAGNLVAVEATIKNTGTGNSFKGLKVMNSGTDAASVAAMIDQGEATYMDRVAVMKFTDLDQATVADFICRADSYTYRECEFGFDTLVQSAARPTFWFKNDGATRAKNGRIIDPLFVCSSSEATKSFIKIENTSSLAFQTIIKNPIFSNALVSSASAAALNDAVTSASGLVEGNILIVNPASNTTEFCSTVTDQIKVVGPAVSAQAGEAVTPT